MGKLGTYWKALYINNNSLTYFTALELNIFPKNLQKFKENENIITMYLYNASIRKSLLDYTN